MPLSDLISSPAELLAHWPQEPRLWRHKPDAFNHLLTLEEVNDWIAAECVAMRNLVLVKDGRVSERYLFGAGDMPFPGKVREHLDGGGTVSLRELQTVKPSLARLRDDVQRETGCLAHINAYMTPPGCQGLKYHYDPYVTLIVQVAGCKTWPLHAPFFENPLRDYGNFMGRGFTDGQLDYLANTEPAKSFTLEPGDVFWLPRGWVHSPYTEGSETSLHLTFALAERTYHWMAWHVAGELLAQALVDPALRAGIPPAEVVTGPEAAARRMREYLIGALLHANNAEMAELARESALVAL